MSSKYWQLADWPVKIANRQTGLASIGNRQMDRHVQQALETVKWTGLSGGQQMDWHVQRILVIR